LTDVNEAAGPVQVLDVSSGKIQDLATPKGLTFFESAWMPGGSGLVARYRDPSTGQSHNQIGFVAYPSGLVHSITKDTNNYTTVSLSADGKTLATVQQKNWFTLFAIPAGGTGANPPSPAIPTQQKGSMGFAWSGSQSFYLIEDGRLERSTLDGTNQTTIASIGSGFFMDACSDGQTVVFQATGQAGGAGQNIWRVNADGSNMKQLTSGANDVAPACSRDSEWVYYRDATDQINRISIDGGKPEIVPGSVIPHGFVSGLTMGFAPDGNSLVFLVELHENNPVHKIALLPLDAGAQAQLRLLDPNPAVSPFGARFTSDGKALVYPITQDGVDNLWLQPLDGSAGRQITNFKSDRIVSFAWSPDAKMIGVLQSRIDGDVVLLRESSQ